MLRSNSPRSPKMAYSIPWLLLPTDCRDGGQRSRSNGRLAALGTGVQRAPWPSSVLSPSAPFQHLYLAVCVQLHSRCHRLGPPGQGTPGRAHDREAVPGSGWHPCSWAGRGHRDRFRVGGCQACPGCSLVRGSQEPITGGEGLGPSGEGQRGADRGRLVSWPVTPLSRYSRSKSLGHPQPCLQTTWLRQAELIPPTREDLRARKTQEQMVSEQQFKDVQQASYRLRAENMETFSWTGWKRFLPPHSQGQRRLCFFYKREICFRRVSLNKDLLGPFSHLGPCGGLLGGGLLK